MRRVLASFVLALAVGSLAGCGGSALGSSSNSGAQSLSLTVLKGQYAFSLAGVDASGNPMGMAGSLTADGAGHITAGEVDINDNGTTASVTSLSGTYGFDNGGENSVGTISLTNIPTGITGITKALRFGFALQDSTAVSAGGSATGTFGDIMDLSSNDLVISGTMQQQSSPFSLSALAGSYVITINGRSSASPTSILGRFTIPTSATSPVTATSVAFDRSVAGQGSAGPTTGNSAASVVLDTAPDSNGRGTMTVMIIDTLVGNTAQSFAYYAINANRFIAVETQDATGGAMTADASLQGALTASSVNTTGAVFGIAGIDTTVPNEISAIGQLQISGTNLASLVFDSVDKSTIVPSFTLSPESVTFDSSTNVGRGTLTVTNGTVDGLANTLVFYLTASGTGFVLDGTNTISNRAMAGTLTPQSSSSFSATADFPGFAIIRERASSTQDAETFVGLFGPISATTPQEYAILADQGTLGSAPIQDTSFSPLSLTGPNSLSGRGTLTLSDGELLAFYVIGPNQFVFIDETSGTVSSPIFFASPQ